MDENSFPGKLARSLKKHVDDNAFQMIMEKSSNLESPEAKAAWAQKAMIKLDKLVPDDKARWEIMSECACHCQDEHIEDYRAEYNKHKDIDKLIDYLHGKAFKIKPVRDGNTITITKIPFDPEAHAKATTPEEKRRAFCHCDYIKAAKGDVSITYCYCGANWCKLIWEGILEQPVEVKILKSVMKNDDVCQFEVIL